MDDIVPPWVKIGCDESCDRPIAILKRGIGYDEMRFN
jgi:hypothetical protein